MSVLFGRKYLLHVGEHQALVEDSTSSAIIFPDGEESIPNLPSLDFLTVPKGIEVTELRLKANIVDSKKGSTSNSGTSWIEVYNLSKDSQEKIKVDFAVILKAGYEQDSQLPVIYAGQITRVETRKVGADVITRIQMGTASVVRRNVRVSRSPNREETAEDIAKWFASMAAKNGIPTGKVTPNKINFPWPYGYPVVGNLFQEMEDFCSSNGLISYISLGKLYIEPIDLVDFIDTVKIEPHNVKGPIRPIRDGTGKTSSKSGDASTKAKVTQGITFNTFLDGSLSSAKKANVTFGDYKGDYKINAVSFKMDSRGKSWDSIVTCERMWI